MLKNKIVTVVIVNWNTKDDLLNCIKSLYSVSNRDDIEIIVVDNDSSDGSVDALINNWSNVKIINSGDNIGFGRANNLAFKMVNSIYTLILNPDTIVEKDSIATMVNKLENNEKIGAVGCKMKYLDGNVQQLGLQWFPNPFTEFFTMLFLSASTIRAFKRILPYQDPDRSSVVKKIYGGCILIRTDLLKKLGGFDKRFFMYGEDVDLCIKIHNTGYQLYYCAEAEVIHLCGSASKKAPSSFSIIMKCESINSLMDKYHGKLGSLLHRALLFVGASFRIFMSLIISPVFIVINKQKKLCYSIIKNYYICMWAIGVKRIFQK